jgi:hypothetical protein
MMFPDALNEHSSMGLGSGRNNPAQAQIICAARSRIDEGIA